MPVEELKEVKKSKVTKLTRNEKEDYTPEKDGKKMSPLKGYDIEFENGDKGSTRTNRDEPKFKVGEEAHYKTKVLTSDKNPDWSKKIFTYYQPNPQHESIWSDIVFRSRDLYLKSTEIAVSMVDALGKLDTLDNKEAFGKIVNHVYKTIKEKTAEDNKSERLMYQSFWVAIQIGRLPAYNYEGTQDIIKQAVDIYNKVLKIEG